MEIKIMHLPINEYSRPKRMLRELKGVVIHYTATPGATIDDEFRYFSKDVVENKRHSGAHYFVDWVGNVAEFIPPYEVGYHCGGYSTDLCLARICSSLEGLQNLYTLGIEMCHRSNNGDIDEVTLEKTAELAGFLLTTHGLGINNIYRHYDITGKRCPISMIEEDSWNDFKSRVKKYL